MTTTPQLDLAQVDMGAVEAFVGRAVTDAAAAVSVLLTHVGDRLGLYRAMADGTPVTAAELAAATGTTERLVREWLANQTVSGYVVRDPATDRYRLPAEHAVVLAEESSPVLVQGLFDVVAAVYQSIQQETDAFRTGTGLGWGDHHPSLFSATERAFRPGYQAHLVQEWIPALDGVHDQLTAGARVADVGCGHAAATVVLATAYPNSTFVGYDNHAPSLEAARAAAARAKIAERVEFRLADATSIAGTFDLVCFFDCWHDTADPLGTAKAARQTLTDGGRVLLVEPFAGDSLEENATPLGRFGYGISTLVCTPCSISDGGPGLGAQAGEARTRELFAQAGFGTFRRAAQTPLNLVYEARP